MPVKVVKKTIEITMSRYNKLLDDQAKLNALREFGVDNWDGYGEAMESAREARK